MQLRWLQRCEALIEETGQPLERGRIVAEYLAIRDAAITPDVVMAAWRKTGLHPFNPDIFDESAFGPSRPYSTHAHLPASYPVVPELLGHTPGTDAPASTESVNTGGSASSSGAVSTPSSTLAPNTDMPSNSNSPASNPSTAAATNTDSSGSLEASEAASNADTHDLSPLSPMDVDTPLSPMDVDEPEMGNTSTTDAFEAIRVALSQFLPLPGPHFPEFNRTPIPSTATKSQQIEALTADLSRLEELYRSEFQRRQRAESHCANAAKAIVVLKARVAEKDTKKQSKAKRFTSKAKFLMSPEAMAEHQRSKQEKLTKVKEDAEKRERQAGKEEEQRQRREKLLNDPNTVFSGALKGKKKSNLQAIAYTLGLLYERKCEELCSSIQDCLLNDRAKYEATTRFANLYPALDRLPPPPVTGPALQPEVSHAAGHQSVIPLPPLPTPCSSSRHAASSSLGVALPPRHDKNVQPSEWALRPAPEPAASMRQCSSIRPPLAPTVAQPQYSAHFSYNATPGPSRVSSLYYTP